jgi:membrane fusion protein, multidrug efflux system
MTSRSPASRLPLLLLAALPVLALAPGCGRTTAPAAGGTPPGVPVTVAPVVQKDVPVEIHQIATVEPYSSVSIRAQQGGVLQRVHFREGQDVRIGDLLFTLDARPYEAALKSAQAALARDSAQLKTAQQDVARYSDLVKKEYVTQEEFDRISTSAASLEAAVGADRAAIDNATVQLEYCTIRSAIDGRTGQLMVHAGNLIKANDDKPLVVINQISPIYVSFAVPESSLPEIKAGKAAGRLEVRVTIPGGGTDEITGSLSFIDNEIDRGTGTVRLKATFPNRDRVLWPGQFVNATLRLATRPNALVVPTQAIQTGQRGPFLYVVKPDGTVESREITPGPAVGSETVIEKGVQARETVVTDGQLRLVPGARIDVKAGLNGTPPPGGGSGTVTGGTGGSR